MSLSRRRTVPQELNDSEDVCVNSESFEGDDDDDDEEQQQQQQQKPRMTVLQNIHSWPKEMRNLVAGGIAGATAKSVVAPLDRIKILYQVSSMPFSFRELPNVMRKIIQTEGLDALWKGNTATMVRVFPYSGIQFMTYDRIKTIFLKRHEHGLYYTIADTRTLNKTGLTPIESLLAGMTAGTISVICTYPLDLTRAQLAVLKKHNASTDPIPTKSFSRVLHENYQQRGFPGLFRGITPTLLGILPYSGIAFTLNEQGKREMQHVTGRDLTTIERMLCGAFAGLVAQTVTYPIEVTRRRMQTLGVVGTDTALSSLGEPAVGTTATGTSKMKTPTAAATTNSKTPPTMGYTIQHLYREQGLKGFMKGVTMNWLKGPIAFSISFTTYDSIQAMFMSPQERSHRPSLKRRLTGKG